VPGMRVRPPRSWPVRSKPHAIPAKLVCAARASIRACVETPVLISTVPRTIPGGNPVTAVPGLSPRSPVTILEPVLVIVEPPRTAKLCAVPRLACACSEFQSIHVVAAMMNKQGRSEW
jgi:hypothetical protein